MKKCPKCKAEIQEEARFCLYCMTSFEEKRTIETPKGNNKRWLIIIATVLVLVLIVDCVFLLVQKNNSTTGENDTLLTSSISSNLDNSNDNSTTPSEPKVTESQGNETSAPTSSNQIQTYSKDENSNTAGSTTDDTTTSSESQSSSTNSTTDGSPSNPSTSTPPGTSSSESDSSNSNTSSSTPAITQPKYSYIEATIENAYPTGYSAMYAPENAIVITKVNYKEESGNYIIPDTIDGKKVAAIMPSAFSDSSISLSVKSVTLPATVRTIWGDAFKNCLNLTDLYIKSTVIGIYENAFPASVNRNGKITFHCKRDCRDFDFYYYRNIANKYDAEYEEWNG